MDGSSLSRNIACQFLFWTPVPVFLLCSSGLWHSVVWCLGANFSEEHTSSTFSVFTCYEGGSSVFLGNVRAITRYTTIWYNVWISHRCTNTGIELKIDLVTFHLWRNDLLPHVILLLSAVNRSSGLKARSKGKVAQCSNYCRHVCQDVTTRNTRFHPYKIGYWKVKLKFVDTFQFLSSTGNADRQFTWGSACASVAISRVTY
jgi:hypothetical protein